MEETTLPYLPFNVVAIILSFLPQYRDIVTSRYVCTMWNRAAPGIKKPHVDILVIGNNDGVPEILNHLFNKFGKTQAETSYDKRNLTTPNRKFTITSVDPENALQKHIVLMKVDAVVLGVTQFLDTDVTARKLTAYLDLLLLPVLKGVKQVVVLLDQTETNYYPVIFKENVNTVTRYLQKVGFANNQITFLPILGNTQANIFEPSPRFPSYRGPTLLEALDDLVASASMVDKPLRIPVLDIFKAKDQGLLLSGRVEAGIVRTNMKITIAPCNITTNVVLVFKHNSDEPVEEAQAGEMVLVLVKDVKPSDVRTGVVVGDANNVPPRKVQSFIARLNVLNHPYQIRPGYSPVFYCHAFMKACTIAEIICKVDRVTGKLIEERSPHLANRDTALVKIRPCKPLCLESFDSFPALGFFCIHDMRKTVAVGAVMHVTFTD